MTILDAPRRKPRVALYYCLTLAAIAAYFAWLLSGHAFPFFGGLLGTMYILPLVIGLSIFVICGLWRKPTGLMIQIIALIHALLLPIAGALAFVTLACAIKGECI